MRPPPVTSRSGTAPGPPCTTRSPRRRTSRPSTPTRRRAGLGLRHRLQRQRDRRRLDPYPPRGHPEAGLRGDGDRRGRGRRRSSASCSTRSSTAPRRTAASPSAGTGSCALLSGSDSIRDVIAFPKTGGGFDPLTGAPAPITAAAAQGGRCRRRTGEGFPPGGLRRRDRRDPARRSSPDRYRGDRRCGLRHIESPTASGDPVPADRELPTRQRGDDDAPGFRTGEPRNRWLRPDGSTSTAAKRSPVGRRPSWRWPGSARTSCRWRRSSSCADLPRDRRSRRTVPGQVRCPRPAENVQPGPARRRRRRHARRAPWAASAGPPARCRAGHRPRRAVPDGATASPTR